MVIDKPALMVAGLCLCMLALKSSMGRSQEPIHPGWSTYVNTSHDFDICYPPEMLRAQGESQAHDGQTFTGSDGASLAVFWRSAQAGQRIGDAADDEARSLAGPEGSVSYKAERSDWAVRSGTAGARIFYTKSIRRGDDLLMLDFAYPSAQKSRYASVVGHLVACFGSSRPE